METDMAEAQTYDYTVDQLDVAYLAGVVDGKGNFRVTIQPNEKRNVGYSFMPQIRLGIGDSEMFINMIDAYCEEIDSEYFIADPSNTTEVVVSGLDAVDRFVGPLAQFFLLQREQVDAMAEVIEGMQEDKHLSEEGIIELMEPVEVLQENRSAGRPSKYTQQYFKDEFNL